MNAEYLNMDIEFIKREDEKYSTLRTIEHNYGTAGFRCDSKYLDPVMFRMGLFVACLSVSEQRVFGVAVTASHNPEPDNGLKIINPRGEMLDECWELLANSFVNSKTEHLPELIVGLIGSRDCSYLPSIILGRDTRSSGERLIQVFTEAVQLVSSSARLADIGVVSTPLVHFTVHKINQALTHPDIILFTRLEHEMFEAVDDVWPDEPHPLRPHIGDMADCIVTFYYSNLVNAFYWLTYNTLNIRPRDERHLLVDCAHGVGALTFRSCVQANSISEYEICLNTSLYNTDVYHGPLNILCGADYVKLTQSPPSGIEKIIIHFCNTEHTPNSSACDNKSLADYLQHFGFCSLDGDADRLIYYYFRPQQIIHTCLPAVTVEEFLELTKQTFVMLDGDRFSALFAKYLKALNEKCSSVFSIGVVQTAYSNGACTDYLRNFLNVNVRCVKTGVKYLHKEASAFDIGIYFEANGHGTVLFNHKTVQLLSRICNQDNYSERKEPRLMPAPNVGYIDTDVAHTLLWMSRLATQTVGDALSDLMLVESTLRALDMTVHDWAAIYTELPNRQLKVHVTDRSQFTVTDSECACLTPRGLQRAIDLEVASCHEKHARAFVRPSGTENVVRVYAEAETQHCADRLAAQIEKLVRSYSC